MSSIRKSKDLIAGGNVSIAYERRNTTTEQQIEDCQKEAAVATNLSRKANDKKYELLQEVYQIALSCAEQFDELRELAKREGVPCNQQTNLFSVCLKLIYAELKSNRRRVSEYGRALQYLYQTQTPVDAVPSELKRLGGTRKASLLLSKDQRPTAKSKTTKPRFKFECELVEIIAQPSHSLLPVGITLRDRKTDKTQAFVLPQPKKQQTK
ncbi:MAG: hypothetical protein KAH11_08300 [Rhodospirillales bacterium]|nr:hypothetical protein [Rhodospirillales bacterium]